MRRLLFVSYWVPPRRAIGSIRSAHILKHLPKYGWDVTALTARFDNAVDGENVHDCIETNYMDVKTVVKRFLGIGSRSAHGALKVEVPTYGAKRSVLSHLIFAAAGLVAYPDDYVGWLPFAAARIRTLLATQKWDAVLTTAPPWTTNLAVAMSHGAVPWIADFRDLWAENTYSERSALRAKVDDTLERASLSSAVALTASSERSALRLRRRYPEKPCIAISSGFDAEEWDTIPFGNESVCTLLYAGTMYRGNRDPSVLFAALREIFDDALARRDELRVDFFAPQEPWLLKLVDSFKLGDVVRVHGIVERATVLAAERRADRLVVLSWDGPASEGVVAGKLFEYFGARRRILAIGGPATFAVEDLLRETGAGIRCRTVDETKAEVLKALAEHRSGMRLIVPESSAAAYTGEACARQFAEVLDRAICSRFGRAGLHPSDEPFANVR